jgi:hypothetical protein
MIKRVIGVAGMAAVLASRYEQASARAFEHLGQPHRAEECLALKRFYERRKMEEQN